MNGPDVVTESCSHFPELLVWERKKKPEVGTEVEKEVKKNQEEMWPYVCRLTYSD